MNSHHPYVTNYRTNVVFYRRQWKLLTSTYSQLLNYFDQLSFLKSNKILSFFASTWRLTRSNHFWIKYHCNLSNSITPSITLATKPCQLFLSLTNHKKKLSCDPLPMNWVTKNQIDFNVNLALVLLIERWLCM